MNGNDSLLWDPTRPFPAVDEIPLPDRVTHIMVHRSSRGAYRWLYDPAVVFHGGRLYVSWTHAWTHELDPGCTIRCRHSHDQGDTWSDVVNISPEADGTHRRAADGNHNVNMLNARDALTGEQAADVRGLHGKGPDRVIHNCFLPAGDALWALAACYGVGKAGGKFPGLRMTAYVLDRNGMHWNSVGVVAEDCMPTSRPQPMGNGHWIVGGQNQEVRPVVAISRGEDFTHWDTVPIPCRHRELRPSETTIIANDAEVTAIMRKQGRTGEPVALTSISRDFGRTWTETVESNCPMAKAQPFAGRLTTGQRYLISNCPMPGTTRDRDLTPEGIKGRDILTIAVSRPHERYFSGLWSIRNERAPRARVPGDKKTPQFSAPYAVEANGNLYVVYSVTKEDCALSILPVACFAHAMKACTEPRYGNVDPRTRCAAASRSQTACETKRSLERHAG